MLNMVFAWLIDEIKWMCGLFRLFLVIFLSSSAFVHNNFTFRGDVGRNTATTTTMTTIQ